MKRLTMCGAAVLGLLAVGPARGATITEGADFANFNTATFVGTLSVGLNTISGSVSAEISRSDLGGALSFDDTADGVGFAIPDGGTLTVAKLTVTDFLVSGGSVPVRAKIRSGIAGILGPGIVVTGNGEFDVLTGGPATGSQSSWIWLDLGADPQERGEMSFSWSLALTVEGPAAAVPAPAALPLMLTGLAGFGRVARRRRGAAA